MSSIKENLSEKPLKLSREAKIVIIQSEYNSDITDLLVDSATKELKAAGAHESDILLKKVPGAWELPIACQKVAQIEKPDVIITVGLVLKGETPHFDFISSACAQGIMNVSLSMNLPIIFGVLTTNTLEQAQARTRGGSRGDKGIEIAQAAIKMLNEF